MKNKLKQLYNIISIITVVLTFLFSIDCLALEKISIQLKWFHQFQFAGYYAALEKGFFSKEGLDVTIRERDPATDYIEDVLKGKAEYGVADAGLILSSLKKKPVVLLMQIFQHSPHVLLALKSSGLRTPFDLKGKKIMTDLRGDSNAPLNAMLLKALGGTDSIKIIGHTYRKQDLIEGKIDVMDGYITDQPYWFEQNHHPVNVIDPRDYGIDFYGDNLFTTRNEIQKHPKRVKKVIRAVKRGWKYALEHPKEIIDIILKKYDKRNLTREHLMFEAVQTKNIILPQFIPIGSYEPSRYKKMVEIYALLKFVSDTNISTSFFYKLKDNDKKTATIELSPEEKAWLKKHPVIKVHNETNWPPFNFAADGTPKGYSIDYMNLIAKKTGLKVEYITGPPWNEFLEMMKAGKLDVMLNIVKTPERMKYLLYTPHYAENPNSILVKRGAPYKNLKQLFGKTVAFPSGFFYDEILKRDFPQIKTLGVKDMLEAMKAVSFGKADAALGEVAVFNFFLNKHFMTDLEISAELDIGNKELALLNIATQKEQPILASILTKGVKSITMEEKRSLGTKWLKSSGEKQSERIQLTQKERAWLSEHPKIRVHNEMNWPPYNYNKGGKPLGYSIDFMNLVAQKVGLQVEYVSGPTWNQFMDMIRNKKLDVMLNVAKNEEREQFLEYTSPYITLSSRIIFRSVQGPYHHISELKGKKMAVVKGFADAAILKKDYPEINLISFSNTLEAMLAVARTEADATLSDFGVLGYLINEHNINNLIISPPLDPNEFPKMDLHFAVPKDSKTLASILGKGITSVSLEEIKKLKQKWYISRATNETPASEISSFKKITQKTLLQGLILLLITIVGIGILFIVLQRFLGDNLVRIFQSNLSIWISMTTIGGFLAIIIIIAQLALKQIEKQNRSDIAVSLHTVVLSTHESLAVWIENNKDSLYQLASDETLRSLTKQHLQVALDRQTLLQSTSLKKLRGFFDSKRDRYGDIGFFIINKNFINIGSMRDTNIGDVNLIAKQRPTLLQKAFKGEEVFIMPILSDVVLNEQSTDSKRKPPTMFFATPIKNKKGEVLAVLTLRLNPAKDFTRLTQIGRIGKSGETYAFDKKGLLISSSRFEQQLRKIGLIPPEESSILNIRVSDPGGNLLKGYKKAISSNKRPLTKMAKRAVIGESGINIEGYRDYRGVRVLGAWIWDPNLGFGITTEINEREALATFYTTRTIVIIVLGITILLSISLTGISLWLGRRSSIILIKSRDELEEKVEERTKELSTEIQERNRSEKLFKGLLESAPDSIVIVNEQAEIILVNAQTEKTFGYSRDELIGEKIEMLVPDRIKNDHPKKRSSFIDKAKKEKATLSREFSARHKSGKEFMIEIGLSSMEIADEITVFAAARDITERKLAQEELLKLSRAVEYSPASVVITEPNGNIEYVNPKFTKTTGYTTQEVKGKNPRILKSGQMPATFYKKLWDTITEGKEWFGEFHNKKKNGELYWESASISPILNVDGNITHYVAVKEDITNKKIMEDELKKAKDKAEAATKAKSDFLANMSHEIRTPLNAIVGSNYLLKLTDLDKKQHDYVSKMETSAQILLGTINDILDLSKIEANALILEETDFTINEVVKNIIGISAPVAQQKGLEIFSSTCLEGEQYLIGDPLRLGQILNNLVGNAIKFTSEGEVGVQVESIKTNVDSYTYRFRVIDSGIGIRKDKIDTIFEEFVQEDTTTTRRFGGTGLGLALCKRLSEKMGGKIKIHSEFGKGTEFEFTLSFRRSDKINAHLDRKDELKDRTAYIVCDDNCMNKNCHKTLMQSCKLFLGSVEEISSENINELDESSKTSDLVIMAECLEDSIKQQILKIKKSKDIKLMLSNRQTEKIKTEVLDGEDVYSGYLTRPYSLLELLDSLLIACGKKPIINIDEERVKDHSKELDGMKLLLADDNIVNQEIAKDILLSYGASVAIATNGKEACDKIDSHDKYDLILMDVQMPVMDGLEATENIRKEKGFVDLPILALTANVFKEDIERFREAGMNDHLAKPLEPEKLLESIKKWTGREISIESKETAKNESKSIIEGLDFEAGIKRVGGKEARYLKILDLFIQDKGDFKDRLSPMISSLKWDDIKKVAHSLKGEAGNIGATKLSESAAKLENLGKEHEEKGLSGSFNEVCDLLSKLISDIEKLDDK